MRRALPILLILLAVTAGCTMPSASTATTTETPTIAPTDSSAATPVSPTATETPVPTATLDLASSATTCRDDLWVGFWGLQPVEEDLWAPDVIRVGYSVPSNTSFLVVAYVDGTARGSIYENNTESTGVEVDGAEIELNESFTGEHAVRAVIYQDENGNGVFEADIDRPCQNDRGVVETEPETVNFSAYTKND